MTSTCEAEVFYLQSQCAILFVWPGSLASAFLQALPDKDLLLRSDVMLHVCNIMLYLIIVININIHIDTTINNNSIDHIIIIIIISMVLLLLLLININIFLFSFFIYYFNAPLPAQVWVLRALGGSHSALRRLRRAGLRSTASHKSLSAEVFQVLNFRAVPSFGGYRSSKVIFRPGSGPKGARSWNGPHIAQATPKQVTYYYYCYFYYYYYYYYHYYYYY